MEKPEGTGWRHISEFDFMAEAENPHEWGFAAFLVPSYWAMRHGAFFPAWHYGTGKYMSGTFTGILGGCPDYFREVGK